MHSFGPPGVAGKPIEIKNAVERFAQLCRELLNWEYELYGINPPEGLEEVKLMLKGCSKLMFINEINRIHKEIKHFMRTQSEGTLNLNLSLTPPDFLEEVMSKFREYLLNNIE